LDELGYGLAWRVLDSQYFGVAQRRRRVFIAGYFGAPCPTEVLFEPEGGTGDIAEGREAGKGIAHAVGGSSVSSGYRYDPNGEDYIVQVIATLNSGGNSGGFRTEPGEHIVAACGPIGGSTRSGGYQPNAEQAADGQLHVCPPTYPDRVRDIAGISEGLDYPLLPPGLDSPRYRALGNAVTTSVAYWIASRIKAYEEKKEYLNVR
jgi:site-specific DNA-cytosine methylase